MQSDSQLTSQFNNSLSHQPDPRLEQMQAWLSQLPLLQDQAWLPLQVASADASFRRYFRLIRADHAQSFIVMDAPPGLEDMQPFVRWAQALSALDYQVPRIHAQDDHFGFLVLDDFGHTTFWQAVSQVQQDKDAVNRFYQQALLDLAQIQLNSFEQAQQVWPQSGLIMPYSAKKLAEEMSLFSDWLATKFCAQSWTASQQQAWSAVTESLTNRALAQPQVWVHRDYHSRNLMSLPTAADTKPILGVLDFQDAVLGPITYDAVSLIRDCYIDWPMAQQQAWLQQYYQRLLASELVQGGQLGLPDWQTFRQDFDWMGVQRHLKAAGIFARLYLRDGKEGYLTALPLTLGYLLQQVQAYPELAALEELVSPVMVYCEASPLCSLPSATGCNE
ncbi:aminoglycoside phosphotransferase [Thiomicrospira aerophila AL3]|uniref:Aminoglycoside phosphotransferase n=1 Tax=Thiomicrospira aerophila AL3 TaxID=717772 RepID=W0DU32_9GAMM|nr:phosphotransferase [Thiomicrospira aerophila]AHF00768.1 aminoglycoside phosphotransferase [Thiomicrospira aerophila AL3]